MTIEKKNKLKKIGLISWLSITTILSVLFVALCVSAGVSGNKQSKGSVNKLNQENNVIEVERKSRVQPKLVSYDDTNYTITLSADELNNYTYINLSDYFSNLVPYVQGNVSSENLGTFSYNGSSKSLIISSTYYDFFFDIAVGSPEPFFKFNRDGLFTLRTQSQPLVFEYSISFVVSSEFYSDFKSAIELDIRANSGTINDGIFETLTSSVVSFIGSLNSGIQNMVGIFWDSTNSNLTTIGLLSVIVVAVSLCYFLFRLLFGLIRMRG